MAEYNGKQGKWVTVEGRHVFIADGQDAKEVIAKAFGKKPEEVKRKSDSKSSNNTTAKKKYGAGDHVFDVDWEHGTGSANKMITDHLKKNNIPYRYSKYGELEADINGDGDYKQLDHVGGGKIVVKGERQPHKDEDLVDKRDREIAANQETARKLNEERNGQTSRMKHDIVTPEEQAVKSGMTKVRDGYYKTADGKATIKRMSFAGKSRWYVYDSDGKYIGDENNILSASKLAEQKSAKRNKK